MGELVPVNSNRPPFLLPDATEAARMAKSSNPRSLLGVYGYVIEEAADRFYKESRKPNSEIIGSTSERPNGKNGFTTIVKVCLPYFHSGEHVFLMSSRESQGLAIVKEQVTLDVVNPKDMKLIDLRVDPNKWFREQARFIAGGLGLEDFTSADGWRFEYRRRELEKYWAYVGKETSRGSFRGGIRINFTDRYLYSYEANLVRLGVSGRYDISGGRLFRDGVEAPITLADVALKSVSTLPRDGILIPPPGLTQKFVKIARTFLRLAGL